MLCLSLPHAVFKFVLCVDCACVVWCVVDVDIVTGFVVCVDLG